VLDFTTGLLQASLLDKSVGHFTSIFFFFLGLLIKGHMLASGKKV
jgi:hypothetical protein